jgi:hypothetical protein
LTAGNRLQIPNRDLAVGVQRGQTP